MMRRGIGMLVLLALLFHAPFAAYACGPSYLEPIFVFEESPDLPFDDFVAGKIGVVQPTFGRKTLVIAYRYLNGGSFTANEQTDLVMALKNESPDQSSETVVQAWLAARKEYLHEEQLPEIYTQKGSTYGSYDFFPNCSPNAFEVATATLKARVASYGADDANVREWVRGQDEVFKNCSSSQATIPQQLGAGAPTWLQKDREYQIAAALFYSLQFDQASARFEKIAGDGESDWQETANYLVARTLVRQASLADDDQRQLAIYTRAETRLRTLVASGNQFQGAAQKLLGLVKYRIHPEARTAELAELLAHNSASSDLRQDLIDYMWLLDKFEGAVLKAEHDRREALRKKEAETEQTFSEPGRRFDEIAENGLVRIIFSPQLAGGEYDYQNLVSFEVKVDTPETEVLRLAEDKVHRALSDEEAENVKTQLKNGVDRDRWFASYNRKLNLAQNEYEGCRYCYDFKAKLNDLPTFLFANDLTDWIFTLEIEGPETYQHALEKWRQTDSPAWLTAALIKAGSSSPGVDDLMRAAERVGPDMPAFPTIMLNLARLQEGMGKVDEARRTLDNVLNSHADLLPVSALNQFRADRAKLAENLTEFFRYSALKPAAFYDEGLYTSIRELVESQKSWWSDESYDESKEEYEARVEAAYKDLLAADLRLMDETTKDIVDRQLSLQMLLQASKDARLPASIRHQLVRNVWTRAVLLDNDQVARQAAEEISKTDPDIAAFLTRYLQAATQTERNREGLYVLLKSPKLTPFFTGPATQLVSYPLDPDYYLESAWWCKPTDTEYRDGNEVPKRVIAPPFLEASQLEAAHAEFARLSAIGDAKTYLGKRVFQWAAEAPDDPRIPEALFIVFRANEGYKYGCSGWEKDEEIQQQVSELLHERYPQSPFTAKLTELEGR